MAAYARTPSALTWLRVNHLINGLHKRISCKNCLYAVNSYFTLLAMIMNCKRILIINMPTSQWTTGQNNGADWVKLHEHC